MLEESWGGGPVNGMAVEERRGTGEPALLLLSRRPASTGPRRPHETRGWGRTMAVGNGVQSLYVPFAAAQIATILSTPLRLAGAKSIVDVVGVAVSRS